MIDWNALGTWAAVVVALGISLRDTFERRSQRTARYLLTAAQILPDVGRLRDVMAQTLDESAILNPAKATVTELEEATDAFAARLNGMGLSHLKGVADQVGALPESMLIPLVKAIMLSDMLLENHLLRLSDESPRSSQQIQEDFAEWRSEAASIKTALDWVVLGAERRMKTRRWMNPEW